MEGLDYRWVQALDAVVSQRGFERAAEMLCITQSAVSQRIKQLEKHMAQPLLVREQPPRPTPAGQKLLGLYRRVRLLEQELLPDIRPGEQSQPLQMSIATNADSLATWLLPALSPLLRQRRIEINLMLEDESRTLDRLRSGEVVGAISMEATAMPGCVSDYLGRMDYLCVASPDFQARYFADGVNREALMRAPAVAFDQYDDLHEVFIQQHFNLPRGSVLTHRVRSSEAFVKLALQGVAYCLIPKIQIESELASGELVNLTPGIMLTRRIYWHHWALESGVFSEVTAQLLDHARHRLPQ
ncbi:LysR family transcriptional regulator ArgP [Photobacterium halotolerans]|uniref:HTH-type transcriptional regulator ArgP n=1 Tax=Photobacterium halotolerans TaxID=265726 RepID=A0A7X4WF18_9GAMM|nr:LysR family transcriptional regulator ArgP [Photobacterium halotolerans]NAW67526.1 ArgP/LysG family DNA-binding transcriptional regulator [Photobacterium halotolerans]NAW86357.1 ArgP/LysG family DNA-binding transcriptional regulator [Photobacterium halotolerans]NAX47609.1 ArgP/LysG family DNA-binding transcriptional regulator [Photobacterium halotolerans]